MLRWPGDGDTGRSLDMLGTHPADPSWRTALKRTLALAALLAATLAGAAPALAAATAGPAGSAAVRVTAGGGGTVDLAGDTSWGGSCRHNPTCKPLL